MAVNLESPRWCHVVRWFDPAFNEWHQRRFALDTDARYFGQRLEREGAEWVHVTSIHPKWSQPRPCGVTWREGKCSGLLHTPTARAPRKLILT